MLTETIARWTVTTRTFRLMLVKLAYFPIHICLQVNNTLHLQRNNIHKPETVHKFILKAHTQSKHLTVRYSSRLVTGPCCCHQYQTMVLLQLIQAGEVGEESCPELTKTTKETTETYVFLSLCHSVLCVAWRCHTVFCVAWRCHTVLCVAWRCLTVLCVAWRVTDSPTQTDTL